MADNQKLRVRNLVKVFGNDPDLALQRIRQGESQDQVLEATGNVVAISDVSFDVTSGEIFVVMGLSGSGKSTLIRCLNRLVEPTSGSIVIDEEDIVDADPDRLRQLRLSKVRWCSSTSRCFPTSPSLRTLNLD